MASRVAGGLVEGAVSLHCSPPGGDGRDGGGGGGATEPTKGVLGHRERSGVLGIRAFPLHRPARTCGQLYHGRG